MSKSDNNEQTYNPGANPIQNLTPAWHSFSQEFNSNLRLPLRQQNRVDDDQQRKAKYSQMDGRA